MALTSLPTPEGEDPGRPPEKPETYSAGDREYTLDDIKHMSMEGYAQLRTQLMYSMMVKEDARKRLTLSSPW